jgi:beta-glucosidase/6-phospho-beta-glucosidase/beta-galactosidase
MSHGHLGFSMTIWYIFPVLVSCTKKNLAALLKNRYGRGSHNRRKLSNRRKKKSFDIYRQFSKSQE